MVGVPLEHLAAVPAASGATGRGSSAARFVIWLARHGFDERSGVVFDPASGARLTAESAATIAGAAHRLFRYDVSRPIGRNLARHLDVGAEALHCVTQVGIHWLFLGEFDAAAAVAARVLRDVAAATTVRDLHARALAAAFCRQWALANGDPAADAAARAWLDAAVAGVDSEQEPAVVAAVAWATALVATGTVDSSREELRTLTATLVGRLKAAQSSDGAWRGAGVGEGQAPASTFASTAWTSYRLACTSVALAAPEE